MEFSTQEYWSGLPFPSPGDLPDPVIEPGSPALQADSLPSERQGSPDNKERRAKGVSRDFVLSNYCNGGIMNQCGKIMEEAGEDVKSRNS